MNRFLVIRFEFCAYYYYALILCKATSDGNEYRITIMNGDLEMQLCNNNTIRETKGFLQVELSDNHLQNQLKLKIAKALGEVINSPVNEIEIYSQATLKDR